MKGLTVQNQRWSQWVDATTSNVGLLFKGGGYDPRKTGGAPLRFLKCAGLDAAWHETNGRQNSRRGHGMPCPCKFKSDGNVKCARPQRGRWERQRQHRSAAARFDEAEPAATKSKAAAPSNAHTQNAGGGQGDVRGCAGHERTAETMRLPCEAGTPIPDGH